jgi:hypothetical protein
MAGAQLGDRGECARRRNGDVPKRRVNDPGRLRMSRKK